MSINGDDIGDHPTQYPATITDAIRYWDQASASTHVPVRFLEALHGGRAGQWHSFPTSDGQVHVAVSSPPWHVPPARQAEIWAAVRDVIRSLRPGRESSPDVPIPHAGIPAELALISWERDGKRVYACPPGDSGVTLTPLGANPGP